MEDNDVRSTGTIPCQPTTKKIIFNGWVHCLSIQKCLFVNRPAQSQLTRSEVKKIPDCTLSLWGFFVVPHYKEHQPPKLTWRRQFITKILYKSIPIQGAWRREIAADYTSCSTPTTAGSAHCGWERLISSALPTHGTVYNNQIKGNIVTSYHWKSLMPNAI